MTHFRLAILVCACAFACSGTDDSDSADAAETDKQGQPGLEAAPAATGLPGLEAPPDVTAPPADAQQTGSGLASKRLFAGAGTRSPKRPTRFECTTRAGRPTACASIRRWREGSQPSFP